MCLYPLFSILILFAFHFVFFCLVLMRSTSQKSKRVTLKISLLNLVSFLFCLRCVIRVLLLLCSTFTYQLSTFLLMTIVLHSASINFFFDYFTNNGEVGSMYFRFIAGFFFLQCFSFLIDIIPFW